MNQADNFSLPNFEKFMRPSASCQACYSQIQHQGDCIITCQICRSCIHQTHYGSELLTPPDTWRCQRCRYFVQNGTETIIQCEFCPNLRGIMKMFSFQNRKIWIHPECATWSYPLIYFSSRRREGVKHDDPSFQSTYFWVEDYHKNKNACSVCKGTKGFILKCKYYSCKKSYHITCARPLGLVRDLQSFRIENNRGYFPVYCREHIEIKIKDYKMRAKQLKQDGKIEKAHYFTKISSLIQQQLENLKEAMNKCKLEEQMIERLSLQSIRNKQASISFKDLSNSFQSERSEIYFQFLEENLMDKQIREKAKKKANKAIANNSGKKLWVGEFNNGQPVIPNKTQQLKNNKKKRKGRSKQKRGQPPGPYGTLRQRVLLMKL